MISRAYNIFDADLNTTHLISSEKLIMLVADGVRGVCACLIMTPRTV